MPNAKTHKTIGTAAGITIAVGYSYVVQDSKNAWQYAIGGAICGLAMSRLADILEPAKRLGPNHRGVFHGIALNTCTIGAAITKVNELLKLLLCRVNEYDMCNQPFNAFLCRCAIGIISGGLSGHVSHLLADSRTPRGLPVFV